MRINVDLPNGAVKSDEEVRNEALAAFAEVAERKGDDDAPLPTSESGDLFEGIPKPVAYVECIQQYLDDGAQNSVLYIRPLTNLEDGSLLYVGSAPQFNVKNANETLIEASQKLRTVGEFVQTIGNAVQEAGIGPEALNQFHSAINQIGMAYDDLSDFAQILGVPFTEGWNIFYRDPGFHPDEAPLKIVDPAPLDLSELLSSKDDEQEQERFLSLHVVHAVLDSALAQVDPTLGEDKIVERVRSLLMNAAASPTAQTMEMFLPDDQEGTPVQVVDDKSQDVAPTAPPGPDYEFFGGCGIADPRFLVTDQAVIENAHILVVQDSLYDADFDAIETSSGDLAPVVVIAGGYTQGLLDQMKNSQGRFTPMVALYPEVFANLATKTGAALLEAQALPLPKTDTESSFGFMKVVRIGKDFATFGAE